MHHLIKIYPDLGGSRNTFRDRTESRLLAFKPAQHVPQSGFGMPNWHPGRVTKEYIHSSQMSRQMNYALGLDEFAELFTLSR